jgi:hypothetical protein
VEKTVCWAFNAQACFQQSTVQVVSCDGYYLYNLAAPPSLFSFFFVFFLSPSKLRCCCCTGTCLRYCGSDGDMSSTTVPSTRSPPLYPGQCNAAYSLLSSASRSVGFNDGNDGSLVASFFILCLTVLIGVEVCDGPSGVLSGPSDNNDWVGPGWCVLRVCFFVFFFEYFQIKKLSCWVQVSFYGASR